MEQRPPDLHRAPSAHGARSGPKNGPQPALLHELHASADLTRWRMVFDPKTNVIEDLRTGYCIDLERCPSSVEIRMWATRSPSREARLGRPLKQRRKAAAIPIPASCASVCLPIGLAGRRATVPASPRSCT
jgi:hypothetical protein